MVGADADVAEGWEGAEHPVEMGEKIAAKASLTLTQLGEMTTQTGKGDRDQDSQQGFS